MKPEAEVLDLSDVAGREAISDDTAKIVPLRHPWRWVGAVVELLVLAMIIHAMVVSPGFHWDVVWHYLFDKLILKGVLTTIYLTATIMALAMVLGLLLAVMRLSENRIFSWFASGYIGIFRAVPALVQMVFWFNLAALFPVIHFGIPFGHNFAAVNATEVISPFLAATLGLGLGEAGYMAEVFRGGLLAVPQGQTDGARAVGLTRGKTLRYVVLPQAMRSIIPITGNQVIGMLKYTSLASTVSVVELLQSVANVYNRTFLPIPMLIVAAIWYTVLVTILTIGQRQIEIYYGRGSAGSTTPRSSFFKDVLRGAVGRRNTIALGPTNGSGPIGAGGIA